MADLLWEGLQVQLLWVLVALAGTLLLPGKGVVAKLGLGPGRLALPRVLLAVAGFLLLSNGLHRAILALGLFEGSSLAELDRLAREASAEAPLLVLLALGLAPALGEELLFRGLLLRTLAGRLGGPAAVLGSAALFGAAHLDPVHGAAAFLLGAYLGAVAWRAGSVRTPVLCHAANNTLAVLGAQGWVPEPGPPGDPWLAALALGLAAACLALAAGLLQRRLPPADPEGGPHEDHSSGPPRR
jgi:membrane protease YdiL (CAAX protease family)